MSNDYPIRREWSMPNKFTFQCKPIKEFVESYLDDGYWIDPFAGETRFGQVDVTNDLNPEREADYAMEADDFMARFDDGEVDGVLFDPPYSSEMISRHYDEVGLSASRDDTNTGFWGRHRDCIERVCAPNATVLSFGWNSTGVGKTRDFRKEEIMMVCHGSKPHDTICVAETYEPPATEQTTLS